MKIQSQFKANKVDQTVWKQMGDKVIIMNLNDGNYFVIDQVGFFIWTLLDGKKNVHQVAARIVSRYRVNQVRAMRDLALFIGQLIKLKLVDIKK